MEKPLLQTKLWETFQKDLKKTTFFEKTPHFSYLATLETTKIGNYLYVPYGPVATTKKDFANTIASLKKLAKSKNCFFIRIEPQNPAFSSLLATTKSKNAKNIKKTKDLNPKDTWVLDLTPEKSTIISGFSQGTRTRFNQFKKKGLSVETSKNPEDIKYLVTLQKKLAKTKNIGTFSENYLKTELKQPFATLYLVKFEEKIISASLFFDDKTTRYYMQSATDADYKKLPATVALLSTALFDAKEKGLKNFDFWGIAPEGADKSHPWAGFTEFKKSFGGHPVHYCGTHDIILSHPRYSLYTVIRKINRTLRKLKK